MSVIGATECQFVCLSSSSSHKGQSYGQTQAEGFTEDKAVR